MSVAHPVLSWTNPLRNGFFRCCSFERNLGGAQGRSGPFVEETTVCPYRKSNEGRLAHSRWRCVSVCLQGRTLSVLRVASDQTPLFVVLLNLTWYAMNCVILKPLTENCHYWVSLLGTVLNKTARLTNSSKLKCVIELTSRCCKMCHSSET